MSLIEHKVRQKKSQEKQAGDVTTYGDRGWNLLTGSAGDVPDNFKELVEKGYKQNPIVAAAIRMITSAITDAPLVAQIRVREDSTAWEPAPSDHPAQRLIKQPNDRDSQVEFIERSVVHYILGGNAFWKKKRGRRGVESMVPIRPDFVQKAVTTDDDIPRVYSVNKDGETNPNPVAAENIVHLRDIHPLNNIFGMPRLLSAALEIRTDNEASEYVSEILNNHGQPGLIIGIDKQSAKRKNIRRAQEFFEEEFGPGRGRGKTAMIAGASNIRVVGFNLSDLEFPDLRVVTRESIASAIGVDPIMIGLGTASRGGTLSGNEAEEARKKLWYQTILPMARRWESKFDQSLAPEFDDEIRFRFDRTQVKALQDDRNDAIERASEMSNAGAFTPEEIRREAGLEGDPSGDTIVHPNSKLVSPASAVFGEPAEGPITGDEDDVPDEVGDESSEVSDYETPEGT